MYRKNAVTVFASFLLALTVLVASAGPAAAQTFDDDTTYERGRQGMNIPGGYNTNFVNLTKVSKAEVGFAPVRFTRDLVELHYMDNEGRSLSIPIALTYIYFVLNNTERRAFEEGDLNVYYLDVTDGTWQQCNTFLVPDKNLDEDDNKQSGRVACLATQATIFGIGTPR